MKCVDCEYRPLVGERAKRTKVCDYCHADTHCPSDSKNSFGPQPLKSNWKGA